MKEPHWIKSLYETFIIRDLIGYLGPGSILLVGLLCEQGKTKLLKSVLSNWPGIAILVIASYITAIGLRLFGTTFFLVVFHRKWGIFGRALRTDVNESFGFYIERLLWRGDEKWLREHYSEMVVEDRERRIEREVAFSHITGLVSIAFFVLAGAVHFLPNNSLSGLFCIPDCNIVIGLLLASLLFLLGHYRHSHQIEILRKLKK